MKRPDVTPRERTSCQLGVVPVSVVVQFVVPLTSDADVVDTGATAATSGAAAFDAERGGVRRRSASTPSRTRLASPELLGRAARRDDEHVRAELVDLVLHLGLARPGRGRR